MTRTMCSAQCACRASQEAQQAAASGPETVAAGDACDSGCGFFDVASYYEPGLVNVPAQTYETGFCPAEALAKGTLFPELVSPYTRGC